ncbi:hypothetical protein BJX62DRAFT_2309 [Aspergillus germanicus]
MIFSIVSSSIAISLSRLMMDVRLKRGATDGQDTESGMIDGVSWSCSVDCSAKRPQCSPCRRASTMVESLECSKCESDAEKLV